MSRLGRRGEALVGAVKDSGQQDFGVTRPHRPDYQIALYMGLLMLLGLIIIYAIGPQRANVMNNAYGSSFSDSYFFVKQIVSLGLALTAFGVTAFVPYKVFFKYAGKLLVFAILACLVLALADVFNLGIAQKTLGATRWFNLGFFGSLQPSEILKFAVLIFMSAFLGSKAKIGKFNDLQETIIPMTVIVAISMFFVVVLQRDMGTGISLGSIVVAMLFMGGLSRKNIIIGSLIILLMGSLLIFSEDHRRDRVMTFLQGDSNSSKVSDGDNYHIEHAKIAIGTGGLFGVGIGNSVQATGYLPEAINDSVFAIMGETFGLVGLVTILSIFTALLMRLLKVSDHLVDARMKLLVAGVFGWFGSHVILNVASMIGVFPLTGITLPLLSFGGTSMMFVAAALGLAFQLSGLTIHSSRLKEAKYENSNGRRGIGRTRHASRSGYSRD